MNISKYVRIVIITGFYTVYSVAGIYLFGYAYYKIFWEPQTLEEKKISFFNHATRFLSRSNSLPDVSLDELETLFYAVSRESTGIFTKFFNSFSSDPNGIFAEYGYIKTLKDYLAHLNKNYEIPNYPHAKYELWKKIIAEAIKREPYSNLTADQERILNNLHDSIKKKDDELTEYNLAELSEFLASINIEKKKYEKYSLLSVWSLLVGIAGILITILVSVLSTMGYYAQIKKVSTAPTKKISPSHDHATSQPEVT